MKSLDQKICDSEWNSYRNCIVNSEVPPETTNFCQVSNNLYDEHKAWRPCEFKSQIVEVDYIYNMHQCGCWCNIVIQLTHFHFFAVSSVEQATALNVVLWPCQPKLTVLSTGTIIIASSVK